MLRSLPSSFIPQHKQNPTPCSTGEPRNQTSGICTRRDEDREMSPPPTAITPGTRRVHQHCWAICCHPGLLWVGDLSSTSPTGDRWPAGHPQLGGIRARWGHLQGIRCTPGFCRRGRSAGSVGWKSDTSPSTLLPCEATWGQRKPNQLIFKLKNQRQGHRHAAGS